MKNIIRSLIKNNYIFIISLLLLVTIWFLVSHYEIVNKLFLPTPSQLANSVKTLFLEKEFLADIYISIFRVFSAFSISVILAVPLAVLMCSSKSLYNLLSPYIDFTRYLPVPALIPLMILFFGIDEGAKIALLFVGTFFQLILLIIDDIRNIPKEYYHLAYSLNYSKLRVMGVTVRSILPQIYDNGRITLGWCWTYLIIAELVAADQGIGHMIKEAQRFSNTPDVYTGILTMGMIGFLSDYTFKKAYPYFFKYESSS